ncbi:MAG: hypothetical protein B0W54_06760 [Cellvibrio sp. 79]|nr:MAG: hypothetical protein B0W54_06760 [Cellvibrio sp. 79]
MKIERYFLSVMITLLSLLFTQAASAGYMKYTYQTPVMYATGEQSYDEDGNSPSMEFFWKAEEQFNVEFIIPELDYELEEMEVFYKVFEDPVISVTSANFFRNATITSSSFALEAWKVEGFIIQSWSLSIDIADSSFPNNMERRASLSLNGGWDHMTFYQDNFYIKRCAGQYPPEWEMGCWSGTYDSVVEFRGEDTSFPLDEYPGGIFRLFGERVSVPEPLSPLLLLTGVVGIFFSRRIKFRNA